MYSTRKSTIFFCLFILKVSFSFSQKKYTCDTIVLKNGQIRIVKIVDINPKFISYEDCSLNRSIFEMSRAYIDTIKRAKDVIVKKNAIYTLKDSISKQYLDATLGILGIGIGGNRYFNYAAPILFKVSVGYQFKQYCGLGVSYLSISGGYDYSPVFFRNFTLDYRLKFSKNALLFHGGLPLILTGGDDNHALDRSKSMLSTGISWTRYLKNNQCFGINLFYSKFSIKGTYYSGGGAFVRNTYHDALTFYYGVSFPNHYKSNKKVEKQKTGDALFKL